MQHGGGPGAGFLGGAVVDAQLFGTAADIDAAAAEHHRLAIDPLVGIAHDEQVVGAGFSHQGAQQGEGGEIKILGLLRLPEAPLAELGPHRIKHRPDPAAAALG